MTTPRSKTLVLGTRNRGKARELVELLAPLGVSIETLADHPTAIDVVEDGSTFAENAAKKACQQARHLDRWVLGEDSGISVAALDGAPGIYSARFSDPGATDEKNNRLLLERLGNTPPDRRAAWYTCHAVVADPAGEIVAQAHGECHGRIRSEPAGSAGFGYDPLFEVVEYHRTFGELGETVKSILSHRARALRQLVPQIAELVASGRW